MFLGLAALMRLTPRNRQFYDMFSAAGSTVLDAASVLAKLVNAGYHQRCSPGS
jgi:hypothetical protein